MSLHATFSNMAPKLLGMVILLHVYAVTAVPLLSSENEDDIILSNRSPMKEPATSSFLRLFSETIAAVPVAVLFAENPENALMRPTSREPREGRRIDDRPKGFMIIETADGSYEGVGPFIEFSSEVDGSSNEYLSPLGLVSTPDDPHDSWFMRSKSSDPVIISEIVLNDSQESSDDSEGFSSEVWVYDDGEQVSAETANGNNGFVVTDYFLPTRGNTRMVDEEAAIFITETNDEQVPLVLEEERLLEVPSDQLVPVIMPSEEKVLIVRWSDDQITLSDSKHFKEEPHEITVSVPARQSYPFTMPLFSRFISPWGEYTKKSNEKLSHLPPIFIEQRFL